MKLAASIAIILLGYGVIHYYHRSETAFAQMNKTALAHAETYDELNSVIRRTYDEADTLAELLRTEQAEHEKTREILAEREATIANLQAALEHEPEATEPEPVRDPNAAARAEATRVAAIRAAAVEGLEQARADKLASEITSLVNRIDSAHQSADRIEADWARETGIKTSQADKDRKRQEIRTFFQHLDHELHEALRELRTLDPVRADQLATEIADR